MGDRAEANQRLQIPDGFFTVKVHFGGRLFREDFRFQAGCTNAEYQNPCGEKNK